MMNLLKSDTLAQIIADLEEAEAGGWAKSREHMYLMDATAALMNIVGPEEYRRLVNEAAAR